MKNIILLSFICFFASVADAQKTAKVKQDAPASAQVTQISEVANPAKAEETLVLKEDSYDFGKIPQGKPVTHIFEIKNSGSTDLKIDNVQASCGCTTPEWNQDESVKPAASSKITVGYNAAAEGPFNKMVTITYNQNQSKQITIKGEVWKTPTSSAPANAGLEDLKN